MVSDLADQPTKRGVTGQVDSVIWSPNPDSDPAGDLALVERDSPVMTYSLFNPVTGQINPLPDILGLNFQSWYWRK